MHFGNEDTVSSHKDYVQCPELCHSFIRQELLTSVTPFIYMGISFVVLYFEQEI